MPCASNITQVHSNRRMHYRAGDMMYRGDYAMRAIENSNLIESDAT